MDRTVERLRLRSGRPLPVIALDSGRSGPTVVVTGNIHGDEVTGLVASHQLDAWLQTGLRRGRVVLYPSLNPGGLAIQRRVLPDDGSDMNRLFPGDSRGSEGERLVATVWDELLARRPDCLVDLHADSASAIPYAIIDRAVGVSRRSMADRLEALGAACGVTLLREYPEAEYLRFGLDRSLAGAMVNHAGVLAITVESGPRRVVDLSSVAVSVGAVRRVLHHLDMVDEPLPPDPSRREGAWRRASAPRARSAGVFVPRLEPGARFEKGELLGAVHGLGGEVLDEIRAPAVGLVVSWLDGAWVEPRGVTGTLGLVEA